MKFLKSHVTRHNIMAMDNSMQKGTSTAKRLNKDSVFSGWYQAWLSKMIVKVILKCSTGTVPHNVTQEACCTSSNLEAYYSLHASELAKADISEYNTSYD